MRDRNKQTSSTGNCMHTCFKQFFLRFLFLHRFHQSSSSSFIFLLLRPHLHHLLPLPHHLLYFFFVIIFSFFVSFFVSLFSFSILPPFPPLRFSSLHEFTSPSEPYEKIFPLVIHSVNLLSRSIDIKDTATCYASCTSRSHQTGNWPQLSMG